MLTVEQISKRYGHRTALREVSFTAETGEIIALLENPSTGKRERCRVGLVTFTEASIATFEKKSIITESIPYKFSDFEFLETISA